MIVPQSLWEKDVMRKCPRVADVEAQMAYIRSLMERNPAHHAKQRDWQRKLNFLLRLREHRAAGRGI